MPKLGNFHFQCLKLQKKNIMGGFASRHEPKETNTLQWNIESFNIFEEARLMAYFERLNGFHKEIEL